MELGLTVWLTGLPCSGKSTLAVASARTIREETENVVVILDGDMMRDGLCHGLGFSDGDRKENLRRASFVCRMLNAQGVDVLAAFVSPTLEMRDMVALLIDDFYLVHVACPSGVCESRDVKGMWRKARAGEIAGFTGYDAPYDVPEMPDLVVDTSVEDEGVSMGKVVAAYLSWKGGRSVG